MGIYRFNPEDAQRFAHHIGMRYRTRDDQLELMSCPYCRCKDKHTFGISLKTGQFECKRASCGAKGNMITLSRDFNFSLGKEADAYYGTVDYSTKSYKHFRDSHRLIESRDAAVEYMQSRGIPEAITRQYEITTRKDNDGIIVFPFKDQNGELTFVKYRNINYVKGQKGSKEFCEANCKPILFGINHCTGDDTLIITEGQIDSLSVVTAGYRDAVSVPTGCNGFTWIPYCFDFVSRYKRIIVMGDCENGKITLAEELSKRWPNKVRVCRQDDYKGCKDANEILQKHGATAIRDAIENAEAPYNAHIKPLSKVKQVDIMKITSISTGIPGIDSVLDGGFRLGQLAVLTGRRGEGKSTIASMFGVRAMEQGFPALFYSGELMDFYFRNWMDCQITGKKEHSQSDHDKLDAWYGNRAYIYDDTIIEDGDEMEGLLQTVETAIIQNNVQFILLDNLMTAIDDDLSTDLYRNQSKFVGNLAALAKKHNVFILLIAHPRKSFGRELNNDDVSGSSNITDKADIVMTYSRPVDDQDPDHRRLQITKNRLTGKLAVEEKAIELKYDSTGSRRITGIDQRFFDIHFDWNDDPYGFSEADDSDEIPF